MHLPPRKLKLVTEHPTPPAGVEIEQPPVDIPTATAKDVVLELPKAGT